MQADTFRTLANIRSQTSSSIVSTLLDLQEHATSNERPLDWIEKLEIIGPSASDRSRKRRWDDEIVASNSGKKLLLRTRVNARDRKENYIALSYTWQPSSNQPSSHNAYLVQSRDGSFKGVSKVRDQVFDRVVAYVNYCRATTTSVRGFWIDQECIDQVNEAEKQRAIQSMEYVYTQSAFPVALLSARIESESHLRDLIYILERENPPRNQEKGRILSVLNLLCYITSDPWWERGWTFQEDYCASTRMCLLIPHSSSLKELKAEKCELLGNLEGELCITSANFRSRATEFCIDYRENSQFKTTCDKILDRAGKYNVQLLEPDNEGNPTIRQSMSPTIFSNVGKREITIESDRLAVIANCLGYSVRLDTQKVEQKGCSLSIAMLALFLLNGEILMNGPDNSRDALRSKISDYLKSQSLRTFQTPDIDQKLTFIKHCRFPVVQLSEEGILTSGHLWRLNKIVEDARATRPPQRGRDYYLNRYQRMRLTQLARHLDSGDCGSCYQHIASAIDGYLDQDKMWGNKNITFSKYYKDLMAEEIVKAMDDQRSLRLQLGSIISQEDHTGSNPYRGIFIREAGHSWTNEKTYVFTAICPAEKSTDGIGKHVSLEVDLMSSPKSGPKRLVIKRWINGLFFFDRSSPVTDVVFPWPKSLMAQ
ncbi:HET-domain-containing protein [Aspergillus ruber CBS 135680]|uniref:HET-domain-containing protein n=1 Tax=Aspergillus ruber (strain CBS 135680) TaxID=1388766 RepID=A0A017S5Z4_ASPRC|nr:HET-domain-containing protein [Aspergillus ruber CBS 135680]EYE91545.1 HET-domain-containing protein [Aspergillus ruber CBS 135680]